MADDIESKVKEFAKAMDKACADLRKARMEKAKKDGDKKDDKKKGDPPVVTWVLSTGAVAKVRTPEEQAEQVVANKSWTCQSAHMTDNARHVLMKVDGKVNWDPKKTMGDDFEAFKKLWGEAMKKQGLKNYKGQDGWGAGDEFHLETPDAKLEKSDKRVQACFEEYAKLTRKDGKSKNDKFEETYAKDLEPYIKKFEK